jgi:O-antigen/teichoic acid export membrane protein
MINHIRSISYFFLSKLLPALALLFFTRELYIRLPSDDFETYSLYSAGAITISGLISGWVTQSNLRFVYKYAKCSKKLNECFLTMLFIFTAVLVVTYFFYDTSLILFFLWALVLVISRVVNSYHQAKLRSDMVLISEAIRSFIVIMIVFFLYLKDRAISLDNALFFSIISLLLSSVIIVYKSDLIPNSKIQIGILKKYLDYGIAMSIWLVISTAFPTFERIILINLSPDNLNDYLAISEMLLRGAGLLFTPFLMYFHPLLMVTFDKDNREFEKILMKLFWGLVFFSIIIILVYMQLSSYLFKYLLPGIQQQYVDKSYLILLLPALWQFCYLVHKKFEATGRTALLAVFIGICLLIYIVGALFLVPIYGVWGSLYAQFGSLAIYIGLVVTTSRIYDEKRICGS